jgi:hypothetical protein
MREFIPKTEMERLFVQSREWEPIRLWRRGCLGSRRDNSVQALALFLNLALCYAKQQTASNEYSETIDYLLSRWKQLNIEDQRSVFKICCYCIDDLIEEGFEFDDHVVHGFLQIMFRIFFQRGLPRGAHLEMVGLLYDLYGGSHGLAEFSEAMNKPPVPNRASAKSLFEARMKAKLPTIGIPDLPPANNLLKLATLQSELEGSTTKYGIKSFQATHALVQLAEFAGKSGGLIPLDIYLQELAAILEDPAVEVSQYDLRRVYYLSGQLQCDRDYLPLAQKIQTTIFARRGNVLGHDMSMTIPLTRLVRLWHATNRLSEGENLCAQLLDWAQKTLKEDDITLRQIKSAHKSIQEMKIVEPNPEQAAKSFSGETWEEPDEFISMLSVIALDNWYHNKPAHAERVINEALAYYMDCSSETARRVGEMLWLLMETDLRNIGSFREKLIELSIKKAFDRHLHRRLFAHIKRLVALLRTKERVGETMDYVLSRGAKLDAALGMSLYDRFLHYAVKDSSACIDSQSSPTKVMEAEVEFNNCIENADISRMKLMAVNELGEQLSDLYRKNGETKRAIAILRQLLARPDQSKDDITKLLTRLAQVHVAEENICEASAVLYLAFNIPEPQDYDPESEPTILPKGA